MTDRSVSLAAAVEALERVQRYEMTPQSGFGTTWDELKRDEYGDWLLRDDAIAAIRALPKAEAGEVDVEAAERYVNGRYVRGAKAEQLFSVRSIIEYALSRPAWQAASGGRDYVAARVAGALKNKHGRVVSDLATDDPDVVVRAIVDAALSSRAMWTEEGLAEALASAEIVDGSRGPRLELRSVLLPHTIQALARIALAGPK